LFGVMPDLACFGKAMANGFPLSAVVGKAEYMRRFEEVFFSLTFGGEAASLAASLATVRILARDAGTERLWHSGSRLQEGTRDAIRAAGLETAFDCAGLAPWTTLRCRSSGPEESLVLRSLFQQECARHGVLTHGNHMLSTSHDDEVIEATLAAYSQVFAALAEAIDSGAPSRRLHGPPMQTVIRDN
jgi:glutamate-1-semialdehyde aminotransferase